jgi:LysM repeat protein
MGKASDLISSNLGRKAFIACVVLVACGLVLSSAGEGSRGSKEQRTHVVEKGDTVWGIARKYGVKPDEIIAANQLKEPYQIFPGQKLIVPQAEASSSDGRTTHIVQKGDTVWGIARKYGLTPEEIIAANQLKEPYRIFPGQELIIPGVVSSRAQLQEIARLCRLPRGVRARRWRYIVIHHSATSVGNAAIFDRCHRNRRMKYGLAYHFVIGNGTRSGDGEIEVGGRWTAQLHGGHCGDYRMNQIGIGICLVGDFEKTHPTRKQMESLLYLLKYLIKEYNVPKQRVIGHRDVRGGDTKCPGKNFSLVELRKKL